MTTITDEQAVLLALHAVHVQGGTSDPAREKARAEQDLARGAVFDWDKIAAEVYEAGQRSSSAPSDLPVAPPQTTAIEAQPGSLLEEYHAEYADAKAAADAAKTRLDAIVEKLKVELTQALADSRRIVVRSPGQVPIGLTYVEANRFNSKRFKEENPSVYKHYVEPSGSWRLAQVKGGEEE